MFISPLALETVAMWDRDISWEEFCDRIVYSMMQPVIKIARYLEVDLKELTHWARTAYFHELRQSDMTLQQISDFLGVSLPTAARLSKDLKDNFYRPELEHQLPERIEFMLWAEPLSRARICQVITDREDEVIEEAIDQMLEEDRIKEDPDNPDRLTLVEPEGRLVDDAWYTRIGSLNSLLGNLSDTVKDRFFNEDSESFARTIHFRIDPERLDELKQMYEKQIWQRLVELEEDAKDVDDPVEVELSVFWHPDLDEGDENAESEQQSE